MTSSIDEEKERVKEQFRKVQELAAGSVSSFYKKQQAQVAKILKKALAKLKETTAELDLSSADLNEIKLREVNLSTQLTQAQQDAKRMHAFYQKVAEISHVDADCNAMLADNLKQLLHEYKIH